jgi:CRP-like cAMP-binding protein
MISSEALTVFYLSLNTIISSLWLSAGWVMVTGGSYGFEDAVFWLLTTMTTTGYGNIVPQNTEETVFVIFACVIGPCVCATIIANFVSLLQRDDTSAAAVSHGREVLLSFLNSFDNAEKNDNNDGNTDVNSRIASFLPSKVGQVLDDMSFVRPGIADGEETYRSYNINSSCVSPPNVGASHSTSTVRRLSLGAMKTFYSVASRIPLGGAHNKTASAERGASQPKSVTDVVNDYFDALDKNGYSCSESSTLAVRSDEDEDEGDVTTTDTFGIPEYFRNEMKFHLIGNIVMASGVFSDFGSLVVREIILNMELRYISKYNVIVSSNLSPQFFGLIKSGNVQVYSAQGRRTQRLTHGDYFGVSSLVSQSKNSDNKMCFRAIALGPCELWTLAPRRFAAVLSACGDQEEHVQELQNAAVQNFQRITDPLAPAVKVLSQMNNLRELDKWFISPQSHEYVLWSAFMATMALFNALAIPTRIAFGEQVGWNSSFFVDYFGDLCFFADIILSTWFVAFYDNDDLVRVRSRIRERYIASHTAWAHFIAALPFDILLIPLIRSSRSVFSAAQLLSMLRVNRLARLFDAQERFQLLEQKYFATTARLRNILRLLKLIFMVLFCSHFIGCTFFFIANYTHIHGSSDNWADAAGILRECSLGAAKGGSNCPSAPPLALIVRQYVDSLYWAAATIATVGYGDIVAVSHREKLYNIFIFLVGTSVYSMAISHLQDIVSQLNITSGTFALRCERINAFLARETASDRITADMKLMLEKSWKYCRGATADEIQRFAPTYLYGHIIEFCLRDAFGSIYFLKNCKRPFIKSITEKLKFGMYLSGSTLFYSGELASNLYIMTKGEIKLVGDADAAATEDSSSSSVSMRSDAAPVYGSLLASRAAGACSIGESEFFMRSYYSCNAKAATDLVCFRLSFEEFSEVLSNHELTDDFAVYHANNSTLLSKTSTNHAVTTFSANMKHAKMIKMMAPTMTESLKKEFVFMPQSLFCKIWYTIYCILLLYFAFSVPFFIAFGFKTNGVWRTAVTLDAISIVFFGVDVFLNLFYFAVEHHGKIVASPPQFRSLYMKEDFLWDLAAVFPLAWFGLFLSSRSYFAFFRVPYLIRLRSIRAVFGKLVAFIETKLGIRFPDTLTRILRAVSMVWYFGHVVCCLFYLIGRLEARDDHASWLEENNLLVGTPSMEAYVWGYLWSMYTITTVGYGNISVPSTTERIVAIGVMITGAILCDAGVAAVLGSVVDSRDRRSGAVKRQVDATRAFCLTFAQSISEALSSQALHYFQYLSHNLGDENEGCDVTLLPPPIWMSLKCEASFKALCKANISSYLNLGIGDAVLKHGCIYTIIRYFEAYLSYPGQVLDTDSGHLFVLRRGKILKSGGEGEFPDTPCYVEPRTAIFDSSRIGGEANRTRYRTPAHGFLRNQHLPSSVRSGGLSAGQSHESDAPLSPPQQLRLYISKVIIEPYGDHSTLGKGSDLDISDYEEDTRGALNTSDSVDVPVNQVSRSFSPDRMSIAHASLRVSSGLETWCHDISGADWASGDGLAIDVCASMGLITTRNGTTLVNINLLLFFQPKVSIVNI